MDSPAQITIRRPPPELVERLRRIGKDRRESMNSTVLRLLDEAVGSGARRARLQHYATWTVEDVREFDEAVSAQRVIDPELWR